MDTLGSKLKKLREEKGFTLEYVANRLNTTKTSIGRYEKNVREPKSEIINSLADFYDVSTDYLLGRTDIKNIEKQNENNEESLEVLEVFKDYKSLSEENKQIIIQLMKNLNNDIKK